MGNQSSSKLLDDLEKLEVIDLTGHPQIKQMENSIHLLSQCRKLTLKKSPFVPVGICKLDQLEHLDLSGSNLKEFLKYPLHQLTSLKILRVSECLLTTFPQSIIDIPNLETLILTQNPLKVIPARVSTMNTLTTLKMSFCSLSVLEINGLLNLTDLDVSYNYISDCTGFTGLTNLHVLDISHNTDITELPENISNLSQLETLYIQGTSIRGVPTVLEDCFNLKELHCSYLFEQNFKLFPFLFLASFESKVNFTSVFPFLNFESLQEMRFHHSIYVPLDISILNLNSFYIHTFLTNLTFKKVNDVWKRVDVPKKYTKTEQYCVEHTNFGNLVFCNGMLYLVNPNLFGLLHDDTDNINISALYPSKLLIGSNFECWMISENNLVLAMKNTCNKYCYIRVKEIENVVKIDSTSYIGVNTGIIILDSQGKVWYARYKEIAQEFEVIVKEIILPVQMKDIASGDVQYSREYYFHCIDISGNVCSGIFNIYGDDEVQFSIKDVPQGKYDSISTIFIINGYGSIDGISNYITSSDGNTWVDGYKTHILPSIKSKHESEIELIPLKNIILIYSKPRQTFFMTSDNEIYVTTISGLCYHPLVLESTYNMKKSARK